MSSSISKKEQFLIETDNIFDTFNRKISEGWTVVSVASSYKGLWLILIERDE